MLHNRVVVEQVQGVEILALIGYAPMCLLSLLLIIYLRVNRREALKGDLHASRKVILPAFEPLLWILAATAGIYVIFFSVALNVNLYTTGFPDLPQEFFYCGRMFVFTLVLVFLCQKSVSLPALRCAVMKTLVLSTYTLPIVWLFSRFAPNQLTLLFFVKLIVRPLLLIFVVYVCIFRPPAGRANSQVLRAHGWFIVVYHVFLIAYTIVSRHLPDSILYPVLSYAILVWSSMCPLLIWRILAADTAYWRGMGKRVCSLQQVVSSSSHVQAASALNEDISSHGLHVLIEMHREFLIDFAHLELKRKIGFGGIHVAMFSGLLRSTKAVAVKVYTPQHFTEEVVYEFSHEAALCASLSHPNVVCFYGMCVCPPTVCLVTELCQYTLEDVLVARGKHREIQCAFWCGKNRGNDDINFDLQRMQLNVAYMLDCSRAVAYIHSFSPPFLHRDIKPANFVVDMDNNLKLTDFSDSRRLPSEIPASDSSMSNNYTDKQTNPKLSAPLQPKMTVTGTVDYMAPEMIGSCTGLAAYAEAADVYSLAITFWDILYPDREKYPDAGNNHHIVFESVLRGSRPQISGDTMDEVVPEDLLELMTSAWRSDPKMRPTASQVVIKLEKIQEELLATLAQDFLDNFDLTNLEKLEPLDNVFTGEHAVRRMKTLNVIESKNEGVRLGRALMDAGFLHHFEHACGFQDSDTSLYFLDDDNISFCQPLAILKECDSTSQDSYDRSRASQNLQQISSSSTKLRKRSRLLSHLTSTFSAAGKTASDGGSGSQNGPCPCRLLGQLQDIPVSPTSGRFRRQHRRQTSTRYSTSVGSNGSVSMLAQTPRRWSLRRKLEPEGSLRNKLLDEEQRYIIDIKQDEKEL